jgi:Dolichyl-phosphate-mannose-protein mannosyltransferase
VSWYRRPAVHVAGLLAVMLVAHLLTAVDSEPFFNNDEIKHTLTGVFVADAVRDLPASAADPKGYSVRYYCQYPALGLVTWPPLFYLVEGLAMLALGPHFWVGRLCVAGFAAVAVVYAYRFARLMLDHPWALLAAAITALTPTVLGYSQRVMLEVPTFACVLASVVHFEKYLTGTSRRDAIFACLLAAAAVLTRFDGVLLLPYFVIRLVRTWNLKLLLRMPVFVSAGVAALIAVPYYCYVLTVYGAGIGTAASSGTRPEDGFGPWNLVYYLATLPEQAGWGVTVAAAVGFVLTVACHRRESGAAFGLLLATYLTFTPLAQLETRHAIYWLPAVAVCAVRPVQWLWAKGRRLLAIGTFVVLFATVIWHVQDQQFRYVFGYSDAARWVVEHRTTDRPILADGEFAGSLVYHTRLHDPARRVWVLRADKVVYNQFSDPSSGYRQYAHTEAEVLELLEKWDPEFVVVEDPQPAFHAVEGAKLLQLTLRNNSGDGKPFEVAERFPVRSNYDRFTEPGAALVVYHKKHRNPAATTDVKLELIGLGRTVGATRP